MTVDDFTVFHRELCAPDGTEQPSGYYPTMTVGARMAALWFKNLQRYSLLQCLRALEQYATSHPRQEPSLEVFLACLKALQPPPPPVQAWFAPAQRAAMREGSYGGLLHSLLPPEGSQAWAKCWIWLFDQQLTFPGREAACATQCRRFAEAYPHDRDDWIRQAIRLGAEALETPQQGGRADAAD